MSDTASEDGQTASRKATSVFENVNRINGLTIKRRAANLEQGDKPYCVVFPDGEVKDFGDVISAVNFCLDPKSLSCKEQGR